MSVRHKNNFSALRAVRRVMVPAAWAVLLSAGLGIGSAGATEVVVQHAKGQVVLKAMPKSVSTLDLAALDTLDALGIPVSGVPSGIKPSYLTKFNEAGYSKIGTLFEPDYEAINAVSPDLIVVGDRSSPKFNALSKLAPTIDISSESADPFESSLRSIRLIANIFGKTRQADARIERLQQSVSAVRETSSRAGTALFVLTTGGRLSAYGANSRFGLIHRTLGFKPAAADISVGVHGQPISFEFIRATNPDWLFVLDRDAAIASGGQSARQLLDNELVRGTSAWSKGQVVYLDPATWYLDTDGLVALESCVAEVAAALDRAR